MERWWENFRAERLAKGKRNNGANKGIKLAKKYSKFLKQWNSVGLLYSCHPADLFQPVLPNNVQLFTLRAKRPT